jgi:hypothetical protein
VTDHVRHVVLAEAGVERHQDCADAGDGVVEEDPLGPVDEPERDVVPGLDPGADKRASSKVDLCLDLLERP